MQEQRNAPATPYAGGHLNVSRGVKDGDVTQLPVIGRRSAVQISMTSVGQHSIFAVVYGSLISLAPSFPPRNRMSSVRPIGHRPVDIADRHGAGVVF